MQQPRARRDCFGELIQIDGSEHHWIEDRGPACSVSTYVDDATGRLQQLRFVEDRLVKEMGRPTLSESLTLQYDTVLYLIERSPEGQRLDGRRVTVIDFPDGRIKIRFEGRDLAYREFDTLQHVHQGEVVSHKRLGAMLSFIGQEQQHLEPERRSVKCPTRRYASPAQLT